MEGRRVQSVVWASGKNYCRVSSCYRSKGAPEGESRSTEITTYIKGGRKERGGIDNCEQDATEWSKRIT